MFGDSDPSRNPQSAQSNPSRSDLGSPPPNPPLFIAGAPIAANPGASALQELTFSYLCENPKAGIDGKDGTGEELVGSIDKSRSKGKEIAAEASAGEEERWVERDFLKLASGKQAGKREAGKREAADGSEIDGREKKVKIETLNLSLALPSHSLSLNSSVPAMKGAAASAGAVGYAAPSLVPPKKSYSNSTRMTNSEDYGTSMSHSFFSHNPSCSLTRNSTENFEYSRGDNDQIWIAGEGTNGSVHSRFKPVGDGNTITFAAQNKEMSNGVRSRGIGSENVSFFPSELPAGMVKVNGAASAGSGRNAMPTVPERLLKEIVLEKVHVMAQPLHELPNESLEGLRECLKKLMETPEKKGEFLSLQRKLERRSDLTIDTLSKAHKTQLEIFIAIRTGLVSYVSGKISVPNKELVEIFLFNRCRNVSCKSLLPVDDCSCKICKSRKGFCSACMCPVCLKFDCAANTCSWVGCDVCSHWCHAACGIDKNLIRPGQSSKGPIGTTEMQFHCPGCDHDSEMFGFVKEVFTVCAKEWGLEALIKELNCVRKIFLASEDFEGKGLHAKAEEVLHMLSKNLISTKDACESMLQFFKYGVTEFSVTGSSSGNILAQANLHVETLNIPSAAAITPPDYSINFKPNNPILVDKQVDASRTDKKALAVAPHFNSSKEDDLQSLETIVKCKEAEAQLFQRLSDEARKEAENYRQIAIVTAKKLEENAANLTKVCLQEAEERRRKKLEELTSLENSNCDYHNMKLRMHSEIKGLLERMEATKKMWI